MYMCVVVFKRRRKKDARIKELEKLKKKLETILTLLNKKKRSLGSAGTTIVLTTSDGRDVERLVADALEKVRATLSALKLEEELRKKGIHAKAVPGGVVIYDESFDHYAADAELAEKVVEEVWKEKRGEGGG